MTVETTTDHATLDAIVADLDAHSGEWVALPFDEKVAMLERLRPRIMAEADAMVRETQRAKGIDPSTVWGAEDWLSGPWAFLQGVTSLLTTLHRRAEGRAARRHEEDPRAPWWPDRRRASSRRLRRTRCCSPATAPRSG